MFRCVHFRLLVFVTLQPCFVVLPGTEGLQGYRDYGFHFRQFLKRVVGYPKDRLNFDHLTRDDVDRPVISL